MEMSILKIQILLHYHYSPEAFPKSGTPAFNQAMTEFIEAGLFEYACGQYVPNAIALECYVNALLTVPLPRRTWNVEMPK